MKAALRGMVASGVSALVRAASYTRAGRFAVEQVISVAMQRFDSVAHGNIRLRFATPNSVNRFRVTTFSSKEPETLEWLDTLDPGAVLWDIGANVGLYSCYAAKRGCRVVAFEPSVFNLEMLARNVALNGVADRVTLVPLALSDSVTINTLNMTTTEWGGALSSFGERYGHDGRPLQVVFEYQTVGLSMLDAIESLGLPAPDYVKMDVDGIEHLILKGGGDALKGVRSVLIEINEDFQKQVEDSGRYLRDAGLVLTDKRHAEMFEHSAFSHAFNQIWTRPAE